MRTGSRNRWSFRWALCGIAGKKRHGERISNPSVACSNHAGSTSDLCFQGRAKSTSGGACRSVSKTGGQLGGRCGQPTVCQQKKPPGSTEGPAVSSLPPVCGTRQSREGDCTPVRLGSPLGAGEPRLAASPRRLPHRSWRTGQPHHRSWDRIPPSRRPKQTTAADSSDASSLSPSQLETCHPADSSIRLGCGGWRPCAGLPTLDARQYTQQGTGVNCPVYGFWPADRPRSAGREYRPNTTPPRGTARTPGSCRVA